MAWITPKTDWSEQYDDAGVYIGDFVNVSDYNRIKNNLLYLRELASSLVGRMPRIIVGADKHEIDDAHPDWENDNYFADEWNLIEDALETIDDALRWIDFGEKQTFYDNGRFIDATELNRIEGASLKLYELLENSIENKTRLAFRLGTRENAIRV